MGPSRVLDSKFLKAVARKEIKQGTFFTANTGMTVQFLSGAVQFKKNGAQKEFQSMLEPIQLTGCLSH